MPTWKEDETEFTVSINFDERRGFQCCIPKPIIKNLKSSKKITFRVVKKGVILVD